MFKKKILAGVMSAAMIITAAPMTALADDGGQTGGSGGETITWKALYEKLIPGFTAKTEKGYYDAVTSATEFSSHHASGKSSGIPAVVNRVLDSEGNTTALDGVNIKGGTEKTVKLASAIHQTFEGKQPNKTYGTDEFVISPDDSAAGYTWNDYLSNIYAVTISDGKTTAGAVPWIDFYGEPATKGPHYNKVEIALNNGIVVADNEATVNRYEDFYGENGELKPGTYNVTVHADGYEDLTANVTVKKKSHAKLTVTDTDQKDSTKADVEGLPSDFQAVYKVDGADAAYENGMLKYEAVLPGTHTVTISDASGVYDPLTGSFVCNTDAPAAEFKDGKLVSAGDEALFSNYIKNISIVNVDGVDYVATDKKAVKVIGEDGSIDLSKTKAAESTDEVAVTVRSTGYPDLSFTIQPKGSQPAPQPAPKKTSLANAAVTVTAQTYTGKALTPAPVVKMSEKTLKKGTDYKVSYLNNINAGKAKLTISGQGDYQDSKTVDFVINKAAQKMTVKTSAKNLKAKSLKNKAQIVKVITVKNAAGKIFYKKTGGTKQLSINAKSGKITVKKKTKKGTYKINVSITAKETKNFKAAAKKTVAKITVR